jgi:RNA polymerase sigma-70 factor, ECF subfamily
MSSIVQPEIPAPSGPSSDVAFAAEAGTEPHDPTVVLIRRICAGDRQASHTLCARYLPVLKRWAHGRLPKRARTMSETDDLVQTTFMRTLANVSELKLLHPGSFLAYLRNALLNQVRDELRSSKSDPQNRIATPLEELEIAAPENGAARYDDLQAYEKALSRLPKRQQELIIMRVEFGLSYQDIAAEIARKPDAVRMMIARAVMRMSRLIETSARPGADAGE